MPAPTDLTVNTVTLAGKASALTAADTNGNTFTNSGRTMLVVNNGSAGSINVTITSQETCNQGSTHDVTVAVGAGVEKLIGPFPIKRFNNETTGKVSVAFSAVTTVTVGAVELP